MRMKKGCDDSPMGSDYLLVLGIILLCNFKTAIFGILCIIAACMIKKKKTIKDKKGIHFKDSFGEYS